MLHSFCPSTCENDGNICALIPHSNFTNSKEKVAFLSFEFVLFYCSLATTHSRMPELFQFSCYIITSKFNIEYIYFSRAMTVYILSLLMGDTQLVYSISQTQKEDVVE